MKKKILQSPFFEVGVKNYFYGKRLLEIALAADRASEMYDVDVLMILPCVDLRYIAERTTRLKLIASHMDGIRPGRGTAAVLPEALAEAGAYGAMLNHCERPMTSEEVAQAITRAKEVGLISLLCADTVDQAKELAVYDPEIVCPEPPELIGGSVCVSLDYVKQSTQAIREVNPSVLVEQAAGIRTPEQVYDFIMAGAQGVGSSSGICLAEDPCEMLERMVCSVRRALDEK